MIQYVYDATLAMAVGSVSPTSLTPFITGIIMPLLVQNHIHLSTDIGEPPEHAPTIRWKVKVDGWIQSYTILADPRRTLTGKLHPHVLKRDGSPVVFNDPKYIVRVSDYWGMTAEERLEALIGMNGNVVYLVDNIHVDDTYDHTPDVRRMFLYVLSDITNINPQLDPLYISIELMDHTLT